MCMRVAVEDVQVGAYRLQDSRFPASGLRDFLQPQ